MIIEIDNRLLVLVFLALARWVLQILKYIYKRTDNDYQSIYNAPITVQYYPPKQISAYEAAYLLKTNSTKPRMLLSFLYDLLDRGCIVAHIQEEMVDSDLIPRVPSQPKSTVLYHIVDATNISPTEKHVLDKLLGGLDGFCLERYFDTTILQQVYKYLQTQSQQLVTKKYRLWWLISYEVPSDWSLYQYLRGYREYIETVDSQKLTSLLQEDPHYIDTLLPWAIAFWLDKKLLSELQKINYTWIDAAHIKTVVSWIIHLSQYLPNIIHNARAGSKSFNLQWYWWSIISDILSQKWSSTKFTVGGWRWGGGGRSW